jgi:non-ribosomal peptide synthetase component E (peptide arylation enzyme)
LRYSPQSSHHGSPRWGLESDHLDGINMTSWYQPQRLELLGQLPRNATGKVDKRYLRAWLSALGEA